MASLQGLAVGDALGSQFIVPASYTALQHGGTLPGPRGWAFWITARAGGDVDTTRAIVGGISAAPAGWRTATHLD